MCGSIARCHESIRRCRAYKAADFKKERNFIGFAKSLPAEQRRELLAGMRRSVSRSCAR